MSAAKPSVSSPTSRSPGATSAADPRIREVLQRYWGFDTLRSLQGDSIAATLALRDSLTVLPTGGGKSLCYQLPPLITGRFTLVVSPLIALMQDQVAGLKLAGVPAAALHSMIDTDDAASIRAGVESGEIKILLVSPERLLSGGLASWLGRLRAAGKGPGHVAIDEAHCISQWGHDFRPEYRRLSELRELLPSVPIGAYTATATPRVQTDIVEQLRLRDPAVLVGSFDRPNLTYRVRPRARVADQVAQILDPHRAQASIVYCISRRETEELARSLETRGFDAQCYHAGLDASKRRRISEHFRTERLSVVVATVAFGMGIDRGDVRCVVHAAMPKSVESYQQETGRAGRDGLPAECVLLYSAGDAEKWRQLMERSAVEASAETGEPPDPVALRAQIELLRQMQRIVAGARCRHRALSEHFGQAYPSDNCGACDVCLGELREMEGGHDTARKILSCVARLREGFGAGHVADVLLGKTSEKIQRMGHTALSTFGLLRGHARPSVMAMIDQLIDAGDLARSSGDYPVLQLTEGSWEIMRSQRTATLVELAPPGGTRAADRGARGRRGDPRTSEPSLSADETALFESLRAWRRAEAERLAVPPYVVLGDSTLEEICRVRPASLDTLINIRGIGQRKLADFGESILAAVRQFADSHGLALDAREGSRPRTLPARASESEPKPGPSTSAEQAAAHFRRGLSVAEVAASMGRATSTVSGYLADFVAREAPASIDLWVAPEVQTRVLDAVDAVGPAPLRPIFEHLGGSVPFEQIRLTLLHHRRS